MRKVLYLIIIIAGAGLLAAPVSNFKIDKEIWSRIDSLEGIGLYRSALELTDQVYARSKGHNDPETEIRALLYKLKYTQVLEEDGQEVAIKALEKELPDARIVQGALKYGMLGELYYRYYSENRWQISQNPMEEVSSDQPLKLWSPEQFYRIILLQYELSLKDPDQLKAITVASLPGLWNGNLADTVNNPTLYDVSIRKALDFIQNVWEFLPSYLKPAIFCDPGLFGDPQEFIRVVNNQHEDKNNPYYRTLKWYADWLQYSSGYHQVEVDIQRLDYLRKESCMFSRDSLYEAALLGWVKTLGTDSSNAQVHKALAQYHIDLGTRYKINKADTAKYVKENRLAENWLVKAGAWKNSQDGKMCANMLVGLRQPFMLVQAESNGIPLKTFPVSIEYRNIKALNYRIVKISPLSYYTEWEVMQNQDLNKEKLQRIGKLKNIRTGRFELPDNGDLNPHRANAIMDPLPSGFYLLVFYNKEDFDHADNLVTAVPLSITRTSLVVGSIGGGRTFYFRDRETGAALTGIGVVPWYSLYDQEARRTILEKGTRRITGADGLLEIPDGGPGRDDPSPRSYRLEIVNKSDTLVTNEMYYPVWNSGKRNKHTGLTLYTDRSLYKPGEEIFFRGVLVDYFGDSIAIHGRDSVELKLQDPRYQVIGESVFQVDSLGVFYGSIKLPYKGSTGNYFLQTKFGQATIRMEQYRRPAFTVTLENNSNIYQPGDTIVVTGKITALSGEPVAAAEIFADVQIFQPIGRGSAYTPMNGQKIRFKSIRTVTETDGSFTFKWRSISEGISPFGTGARVRYSIAVKATDLNGESHQEETAIDCGKGTTSLSVSVPENIRVADSLSATVVAVSSDGRILNVPFRLRIFKLKDPEQIWIEPSFGEPDRFLVARKEWNEKLGSYPYKSEHLPSAWMVTSMIQESRHSNENSGRIALLPGGRWKKGWYKIELAPEDSQICNPVVRYFLAEDPDVKRIGPDQPLYTQSAELKCQTGSVFNLSFASAQNGYVLVDLEKPGNQHLTKWYPSGNKVTRLNWSVEDDWQGGVAVKVILVQKNRVVEKSYRISVPWRNSTLKISGFGKLEQVKPGDSVKIDLLVLDENGAPVRASVGVTVYDASLDLITPHNWPAILHPEYYGSSPFSGENSGGSWSVTLAEPQENIFDIPYIEPVTLNWFGMGYYGLNRSGGMVMKMAAAQPVNVSEGSVGLKGGKGSDPDLALNDSKEATAGLAENMDVRQNPAVMIRKDFRETALFEGNLLSDRNGHVELKFKVPEVFTEWKVLVAGHDRNLAFGNLEHHFKSARDLMIKPNLPEFIRMGDSVDLTARLGWYGKGILEPVTSFTVSDTAGVVLKRYPDLNSKLASGAVVPFVWSFSPVKKEPLVYELKSVSARQSDGVSDTIRVYPDDVQLWNAQPFFFSKPGKKLLKIEGEPLEAMFEVTTTPAWMVLQSLPVVNKQERDCSEYWFSRLYLASLAGSIADRFPGVVEKFLGDSVPIKQKDRVRQIREWMDPQTRGQDLAYSLEKLTNLQNQDGTWPWFRGMGSDIYMTQQIIAGFGELKDRGVFDVTAIQSGSYMVTHAIEAMDKWLYREFREVVRRDSVNPQKVQLSPMIINYLYARSFYPGFPLAPQVEIAWLSFNERIPVEWTLHDPGLQALMAIACVQLGRKPAAMPIFNSLRERAKVDDQWGMYWPRKGYASSWFNWDLWMQSRMIELFSAVEEGRKDLDLLKLNLIHQKRGRDWGNGMVAAWASKSLLFFGSGESIQPGSVGMTWGSEKYSALRVKTGSAGVTGYYRFEWKNSTEMPKSKTMEVTKTEGGPVWGTLFTLNQYTFANLAATAGPLNIAREVSVRNPDGKWSVVSKGQWIHVGDQVKIRLKINSDRELSYIEVKDYLGTGFMPVQALSGYHYHSGVSYYQSREPESVVYYLSQLPQGITVLEYEVIAEQAGSYFGGYATATSLYAPEFRAWSDSYRVHAKR